jgi:AraC-like DNA-binding protein
MQNLTVEDAISMSVRTIAGDISERFLDSSLSLSELLKRSGYAEDYIRAHFKRIIGKTPTAFLHELRIKHACYLIETYHHILPLSEIAAQCGYTDYVLFSKRFKTIIGMSPKEFKDAL